MSQPYGPALLLGVMIGGAILLDDLLAPTHPWQAHTDLGGEAPSSKQREVEVFVLKSAGTDTGGEDTQNGEVTIDAAPGGEPVGQESLAIRIALDDDKGSGLAPAAIDQAVSSAIAQAREEGREPSEVEIIQAINKAMNRDPGQPPREVDITVETSAEG